jgi:hypothetical protein
VLASASLAVPPSTMGQRSRMEKAVMNVFRFRCTVGPM